jgi:hypothetical protein
MRPSTFFRAVDLQPVDPFPILVKRKLYLILQSERTNNWPKYIKMVVQHLNEAQVPKLGYIAPIEINSFLDDFKVREAQQANSIMPETGPTLLERRKNEANYEEAKNVLRIGDLVYLDEKETAFTKQYKRKVSILNFCYEKV